MGRNLDRGLDGRVEKPRTGDSGSKTPKMDQVKKDTAKKINDTLNKKR